MRFYLYLFSLVILLQVSELPCRSDSWDTEFGSVANTRFFHTQKPQLPGARISSHGLSLPAPVDFTLLCGDVKGEGTASLVYATQEDLALIIIDPLTQQYFSIALDENEDLDDTTSIRARALQLVEYDEDPGMEVLCSVLDPRANGTRILFQIVSPRKNQIVRRFYGIVGDDINGNGFWDGSESGGFLFKSKKELWKLVTGMSAAHEDYKPRSVNIYDVEGGQLEAQFHMALPPFLPAIYTTQTDGTFLFWAPTTPDNWLRENGELLLDENGNVINVSEIVDGVKMTDREAYSFCFKYDDSMEGGDALSLEWYKKRGELSWSNAIISPDAAGRILALANDALIREWDLFTPGKMYAYDLYSGDVIQEFSLEEGLSFLEIMPMENTNSIYAILQEEPVIQKYDLEDGLQKTLDFYEDPTLKLVFLGITDMDGDGRNDVIVAKNKASDSSIVIFDDDLNVKAEIPTFPISRKAFSDWDQDGYPELSVLDMVSLQEITIFEYQAETSNFSDFELY